MRIGRRGRPKGSVGKAAILSSADIRNALFVARRLAKSSDRAELAVLMSVDLGLRATELSSINCSDVFELSGHVRTEMLVRRGVVEIRQIPIMSERLRGLLADHWERHLSGAQCFDKIPLFRSQRVGRLTPMSIAKLLTHIYQEAGIAAGSSRSGRRTLIAKSQYITRGSRSELK